MPCVHELRENTLAFVFAVQELCILCAAALKAGIKLSEESLNSKCMKC